MSSSQSRRLSQGRHQAAACGLAGTVDRGGEADRSGGHSREARPDAIGQGSKAEATNRVPRPSRGRSTARMNPTVMAAAAAPNKMSRKALLPELWIRRPAHPISKAHKAHSSPNHPGAAVGLSFCQSGNILSAKFRSLLS